MLHNNNNNNNNNNSRGPVLPLIPEYRRGQREYQGLPLVFNAAEYKKELRENILSIDRSDNTIRIHTLYDMVKGLKGWSYVGASAAWKFIAFLSDWTEEQKKQNREKFFSEFYQVYKDYRTAGRCVDSDSWAAFNKVLRVVDVQYFGGYDLAGCLVFGGCGRQDIAKLYRIENACGGWYYWEEERPSWVVIVENGETILLRGGQDWDAATIWGRCKDAQYVDVFSGDSRSTDFEEWYTQCDWCGELFRRDYEGDLEYVDALGEVVCRDCLTRDGWVYCEEDREWVNPRERVFPRCSCCTGCSCSECELYEAPEVYNSTGEEALDYLCEVRDDNGYSSGSSASALVVDYEEVPLNSAAGLALRSSGLFCGLEIETSIEAVDNYKSLDNVEYLFRRGVCTVKSDSSLDSGCGSEAFEFVTLKLFDSLKPGSAGVVCDLVNSLEGAGFWPDNTCGGHMHFDKLGKFNAREWVLFAYVVEHTPAELIRQIFGRTFGGYCGKLSSNAWALALAKVEHGDDWEDILATLNTGSHSYFIRSTRETVEVRLFSGVKDWDSVVFRCYAVASILEYVKGKTLSQLVEGLPDNFIQIIEDREEVANA